MTVYPVFLPSLVTLVNIFLKKIQRCLPVFFNKEYFKAGKKIKLLIVRSLVLMIVYLVIFSLSQFRSSYQHNNGDIMFLSSRRKNRYILGVFNGSWKLNLSHKHLEWLISFLTNRPQKS